MKQIFKTTDFNLATTLTALGCPMIEMEKINNSKRVEFVFEENEDLKNLIDQYWSSNLQIEPKTFCMQQKVLKSQLYHYL